MALHPALVKGIFHPENAGGLGHQLPHLLRALPERVHIIAQQHDGGGVAGASHGTHAGGGRGGRHGYVHARIIGKFGGVKLCGLFAAALAVVHGIGGKGDGIVGNAQRDVFKVLVRQQDGFQLLHPLIHDRQLRTGPEGDVHGDVAIVVIGDEHKFHLRCQQNCRKEAANADQHHLAGLAEQLGHNTAIEILELTEQAVHGDVLLGLGGQEGKSQRHHHNGAQERGQQRQDDGPQQRAEHHAGHTLADGKRNVHHDGGQRTGQNGHEHGAGALRGGLLKAEALRPVAGAALQNDDGVVHDHADGQNQARAGEDVHIIADEVQHDDGQQHGKREGFSSGIDDYLTKPVDYEELIWRIQALLRRAHIASEQQIVAGDTRLDSASYTVTCRGQTLELPKKEFDLLYKLLSYPGQIFTRSQLLDDVWGYVSESGEDTVKTHISRLRNRLKDVEDFQIITIKGLGYKAELVKEKER